jgi:hypothetical protein
MAKRYIHNDTAAVMFVGGVMLQPGDGREVDELFLPPMEPQGGAAAPAEGGQAPDEAALDANLRDVLKGTLKEIVPTLAAYGDATLARLAELENEHEAPRKGLLEAVAALQLDRAQANGGAGGGEGGEGGGEGGGSNPT